jgi:hypothetical protein
VGFIWDYWQSTKNNPVQYTPFDYEQIARTYREKANKLRNVGAMLDKVTSMSETVRTAFEKYPINYEFGLWDLKKDVFMLYPPSKYNHADTVSRRLGEFRYGKGFEIDCINPVKSRYKYEIIDNELVLISIEIMRTNGNWTIVNDNNFRNRMKVDMFSGRINLFNDGMTGVFMGFTPIYENYIILEIDNGNLIREYEENCYEYLQSIIQSYPNGSYEQNYFIGLEERLNNTRQ